MATTATATVPTTAPGAYDRVFYSGMAIAMALTVVTGFARTYYLRSCTAAWRSFAEFLIGS